SPELLAAYRRSAQSFDTRGSPHRIGLATRDCASFSANRVRSGQSSLGDAGSGSAVADCGPRKCSIERRRFPRLFLPKFLVRITCLRVSRDRSLGLEITSSLINSVRQLYVRTSSRISASSVVEGMPGNRRSKKGS